MEKKLEELMPGDLVYTFGHIDRHISFYKIKRVTQTQIVLENERKYKRITGYRIGTESAWFSRDCIYPITEEIKVEHDIQQTAYRYKDYSSKISVTKENLKEVKDILKLLKPLIKAEET